MADNPRFHPQYNTDGYDDTGVIQATGTRLYKIFGYNKGAAQWLALYNATSAPATSVEPRVLIALAATDNFGLDFGPTGILFETGLVYYVVTAGSGTYTHGAADVRFTAEYH